MKKNKIVIVVVALSIVLVGVLLLPKAQAPVVSDVPNTTQEERASESAVVFSHFFKKGTHTLSGTITLPTPCYQIDQNIIIDDTFSPEKVAIALTTSTDDQICIQVIDEREVEITFDAAEDAEIVMTLDDKAVVIESLNE